MIAQLHLVASYSETAPEFLGMEFERYEIIEGIRYELSPSPTVTHQRISAALHIMLHQTWTHKRNHSLLSNRFISR